MAVALAPSPPPHALAAERAVVAVLALLRFAFAPMLAFGRVFSVAVEALPYLGFASVWVLAASSVGAVVARRVCGEGSSSVVFLVALNYAALKFCIGIILIFLALAAGLGLVCLVAIVSGFSSTIHFEFKKSFGAIRRKSTWELFHRTVVLGFIVCVSFTLLTVAGYLIVMMSSPVEGSQGGTIGSWIVDVGIFGSHGTVCFFIPALALKAWRHSRNENQDSSQQI